MSGLDAAPSPPPSSPRPPRLLRRDGGVFAALHRELMGVDIAFAELSAAEVPPHLLERVRATWHQRFTTEFRSVQIMNRFLAELLAAGDPLEVYAGAVDLIADETRHMALCAELVTALGGRVTLPEPPVITEPPAFAKAPAVERALATAISMLAVNETLSVAFIRDLQARCDHPIIKRVLDATVSDEEHHESFGWTYIERSLGRFPIASLPTWRAIARDALAPLAAASEPVLDRIPRAERDLSRFPDDELARWGLFSEERQALVFDRARRELLMPRLERLGLA